MNRCPTCEYLVPPAWDTCKRCGAALRTPVGIAAAAPVRAPVAPPIAPAAATAPPYAPATFKPDLDLLPSSTRRAPSRRSGPRFGPGIVVLIVVVALGGAAYAFWPSDSGSGSGSASSGDMQILPSPEETAGVPSLDSALRVEAEASVQQGVVMVSQAYAEYADFTQVTPQLMAQYDPTFDFVDGGQDSTSTRTVSMRANANEIVLAVAGRADVCAFARVGAAMLIDKVTAKTSSCRADAAPATGWYGTGGSGGGGLGGSDVLDPGILTS